LTGINHLPVEIFCDSPANAMQMWPLRARQFELSGLLIRSQPHKGMLWHAGRWFMAHAKDMPMGHYQNSMPDAVVNHVLQIALFASSLMPFKICCPFERCEDIWTVLLWALVLLKMAANGHCESGGRRVHLGNLAAHDLSLLWACHPCWMADSHE